MNQLTQHGTNTLLATSQRYGVSENAVQCLMDAVSNGGGYQAQFSHPELGGMGQWSSGGMTMVGDMFNTGLQALVANICADISNACFNGPFYAPPPQTQGHGGASLSISNGFSGNWWPDDLGQPSSSGSQNNLSYAIFPAAQRLAVNLNGDITVYDTGAHMIGGVGQQQSGDASWTFTSQFGTVFLNQLAIVNGTAQPPVQPEPIAQVPTVSEDPIAPAPAPTPVADTIVGADDVFNALEKLGALHDAKILTDDEFSTKKAELLARL